MGRARGKFKVVSIYDTETTNIKVAGEWHAFPVTFQVNTIDGISDYEPGKSDNFEILRTVDDMMNYIDRIIKSADGYTPVLCGYNLMFDVQPLLGELIARYNMAVCAQTSSNVYYIDIYEKTSDKIALRMWDTYHLEMNGLAAMGQTAGLAKLKGDWDYTLIRTPKTVISDEEYGYALRDVQVIPYYLKYLLRANSWLTEDMLGNKVLTKTSLVRRMASSELGPLKVKYITKPGDTTLMKMFMAECKNDLPKNFYDYALRKACFRGGFTFTSAAYASVVVRNVVSLDVTSMHHTFINGRYVPENLKPTDPAILQKMCEDIVSTDTSYVLDHYYKPFKYAVDARIAFYNLRLRKSSAFEKWGIALAPRSKFGSISHVHEGVIEESSEDSVKAVKLSGWRDRAVNAEIAFGKLYSAKKAVMHVTELELYAMSLVYEWDRMQVILGESTLSWSKPPMYVTLQSQRLFKKKQDLKIICKYYHEGEPYTRDIPNSIPEAIADKLRDGSMSEAFLNAYYQSTVKGMFNAIFGTQAQDIFKPSYIMNATGKIVVDPTTVPSPDNFEIPRVSKVFYSYGMRIVGGSRLHLVLAIELMYKAFGNRVRITGGDTDSLKVSCNYDVTDDELKCALEPLATASKNAIDVASSRVRELFPDLTSDLDNVGSFDIESAGDGTRWDYHMEAWNKARVSLGGCHCHITCAGLPRPAGMYNYEDLIEDMLKNSTPEEVLPKVLGYNVSVSASVGYGLQRTHPDPGDMFNGDVTDYLGESEHVIAPESIALYSCGRMLGDTSAPSNMENVDYLKRHYGRAVDTGLRYVGVSYDCDINGMDKEEIKHHATPYVYYEEDL